MAESKEQVANQFISSMVAAKWDKALKCCNEELQKAFGDDGLKNIWKSVIAKNGVFQSRKVLKVEKNTVYVLCSFEKWAQLFRIPITADKLTGFWGGRQWPLPEGTEEIPSFDGFELTTKIEVPNNLGPKEVKRAIVFIHGSGPQNLEGTDLHLHGHIAKALRKEGFATIRYNKRSFQVNVKAELGEIDFGCKDYMDYDKNFIHYFIKDGAHMAKVAKKRFPQAKIYLFGHSQGARLALYAAKLCKDIEGMALFGLSFHSLDTAMLEQGVYRHLNYFDELDIDSSNSLSMKEAAANERLASAFSYMDMNEDGVLDKTEFKATDFSNLIATDWSMARSFMRQQLELEPQNEVIEKTELPILVLQGEWDHQVQAYQARALELVNKRLWKKKNLHFLFFPKVGHALNEQKKYYDFDYKEALPRELLAMAKAISKHLGR